MGGNVSLEDILESLAEHWNAEEAAKALGLSRRTLFYRLQQASKEAIGQAYRGCLKRLMDKYLVMKNRLEVREWEINRLRADNEALARRNAQLQQAIDLWKTMDQLNKLFPNTPGNGNPFKVLSLSEDAPKEVVDAVWKALAWRHHPDVGGNAELMKKINVARDSIYRMRGWR